MQRLGLLALVVVAAIALGFAIGRWREPSWPNSVIAIGVDAFQRCATGGRDCGYYPSVSLPGVLATPPEPDVKRHCALNREFVRADVAREYARVIVRCTSGNLIGEYRVVLTRYGNDDWRDPTVSYAYAASNEAVVRSELGEIVGPASPIP